MPDDAQVTFQLTAHGDQIEVRASAPGGEARAESDLPPLAEPDRDLFASAQLLDLGRALYRCLTAGELQTLVEATLQRAADSAAPARFELRFDHDQVALARYPWETVCDDLDRPLVRDGLVDLTRYITYPRPPPSFGALAQRSPLLRLICQPGDQDPLSLADLTAVPVDTLRHATFDALRDRLLIERLDAWGLHFDGHGALLRQCRVCETLNDAGATRCLACQNPLDDGRWVGALAFERQGVTDWVTTAEMGATLYNAEVQFAMLLACETARVGGSSLFSGLAPGLLLAGVPAVLGMQYPVSDGFASRFANRFYRVLLDTKDVMAALRTARQASVRDTWYSPVLYLRHRPTPEQVAAQPAYQVRHVDTAVPAQAQAGVPFLTRLWIRRPDTPPLSERELRAHLGIAPTVDVDTQTDEAEVRFEPVEGRRLRRGRVEVQLTSSLAEVTPPAIPLFVDEGLDAPPAIFTVRATAPDSVPLLFAVYQEGVQIVSLVHHVQVVGRPLEALAPAGGPLQVASHALAVEGGYAAWDGIEIPAGEPGTRRCRSCGTLVPQGRIYCPNCGHPFLPELPELPPFDSMLEGDGGLYPDAEGCVGSLLGTLLSAAEAGMRRLERAIEDARSLLLFALGLGIGAAALLWLLPAADRAAWRALLAVPFQTDLQALVQSVTGWSLLLYVIVTAMHIGGAYLGGRGLWWPRSEARPLWPRVRRALLIAGLVLNALATVALLALPVGALVQ
jgi:hypothetical protein